MLWDAERLSRSIVEIESYTVTGGYSPQQGRRHALRLETGVGVEERCTTYVLAMRSHLELGGEIASRRGSRNVKQLGTIRGAQNFGTIHIVSK